MKRVQKEEEKATAKLFKGSLGPPPKPRPEGSPSSSTSTTGQQQQRAAAGVGSSSRAVGSNNRGVTGFLQPLFALMSLLVQWLQQVFRLEVRPKAAVRSAGGS